MRTIHIEPRQQVQHRAGLIIWIGEKTSVDFSFVLSPIFDICSSYPFVVLQAARLLASRSAITQCNSALFR